MCGDVHCEVNYVFGPIYICQEVIDVFFFRIILPLVVVQCADFGINGVSAPETHPKVLTRGTLGLLSVAEPLIPITIHVSFFACWYNILYTWEIW